MKARKAALKTSIETDNDWIRKDAAAKLLGVSVRQIENRAARGEIEKRTLPKAANERAARVEYSRRDVEAIKSGAGRPKLPAAAFSNGGPAPAAVAVRAPAGSPGEPLAALAAHLAQALGLPAHGKPWLSLREASEYSGLPARHLVESARSGQMRARNVGVKRERWMFPREGLS